MTEKEGTLKSVASNGISGIVTEKDTLTEYEFIDVRLPEKQIVVGENIVFVSVATPSGKIVGVEIKRPTQN